MSDLTDIDKLLERIESLETELAKTNAHVSRMFNKAGEILDSHMELQRYLSRQLDDMSDRLAHVEGFVFPDLANELKNVNDIIGENDGRSSKLDRRDDL